MAKQRKNLHYFLLRVSEDQTVRLGVKARGATKHVTLKRSIRDVMKGTEGMSITCAHAQCALSPDNRDAFPHPALLAEFTDRRAYIVDKLDRNGTPKSCVVYEHMQGDLQKTFDRKGKNTLAKMSGIEGEFTLYPAHIPLANGRRNPAKGNTSGPSGKPREPQEFGKGAIARARRAGINIPMVEKNKKTG